MYISPECIFKKIIKKVQTLNYPIGSHQPKSQIIDLSIVSTKTKYIKLNTKTQYIFCRLDENLATFLYTLTGVTRKQKEKKVFSFKVYTKVECY